MVLKSQDADGGGAAHTENVPRGPVSPRNRALNSPMQPSGKPRSRAGKDTPYQKHTARSGKYL